jgi:ankyrin repeat protein
MKKIIILGPNHNGRGLENLIEFYKVDNTLLGYQKESIVPQDIELIANNNVIDNRIDIFFHGERIKETQDSKAQHYILLASSKEGYHLLETKLLFSKLGEQSKNTPLYVNFWSCYGNLAAIHISELPARSILITHNDNVSLIELGMYAVSHQLELSSLSEQPDILASRWQQIYQNLKYDYLLGDFIISYINEDKVIKSFKWINDKLPILQDARKTLRDLCQAFYNFFEDELKLLNISEVVLEKDSLITVSMEEQQIHLWSALIRDVINSRDERVKENLSSLKETRLEDIINLDVNGTTLLDIAANQGKLMTIELLLKKGVVPSLHRPLHFAAMNDYDETIKFLISFGWDVSQLADRGDTLLHTACRNGALKTVSFLLSLNIENEILNDEGYKPSTIAILKGHLEIMILMLDHGYNILQNLPNVSNFLLIASSAEKNECQIIRCLMERKLIKDINFQDDQGITALTNAVMIGKPDVVKCLLEDCNANPTIPLKDGYTAYDLAQEQNNVEMMKILGDAIASMPTPEYTS